MTGHRRGVGVQDPIKGPPNPMEVPDIVGVARAVACEVRYATGGRRADAEAVEVAAREVLPLTGPVQRPVGAREGHQALLRPARGPARQRREIAVPQLQA